MNQALNTIKLIKDFKIALKDFEPMVKEVKPLITGREISNFCLRPREAWANWLLCVVLRKVHGRDITFAEDHEGDGIIIDKTTDTWVMTEHVSALDSQRDIPLPKGEDRVIDAINHKIDRGFDYAAGKNLIVFFDGAGEFYRNKIRESIAGRHNFLTIYAIGLMWSNENGYAYSVTEFDDDLSTTFKVVINGDFTDWTIYWVRDALVTTHDGVTVGKTLDFLLP